MTQQPEQSQTGTRSTSVAHPPTAYCKQQFLFSSHQNRVFLRISVKMSHSSSNVSTIQWDELDDGFWTPEQRRLLEEGGGANNLHVTLAILLTIVIICSLILNSGVLYVLQR